MNLRDYGTEFPEVEVNLYDADGTRYMVWASMNGSGVELLLRKVVGVSESQIQEFFDEFNNTHLQNIKSLSGKYTLVVAR